jgi:hypothetical protein
VTARSPRRSRERAMAAEAVPRETKRVDHDDSMVAFDQAQILRSRAITVEETPRVHLPQHAAIGRFRRDAEQWLAASFHTCQDLSSVRALPLLPRW